MALLGKAYAPTFTVLAIVCDAALGLVVWRLASGWCALAAMVLPPLAVFFAYIMVVQPTSGEG